MRLTLRTLLAYLDNVLESSEKATLGDKISKSQTSKGIIDRIRRVLAASNISAPKIGTPGSVNDPNPIAEYLDNTYPAAKISEIEVRCLSDDVRLAEVAACHQILALVLNQPASVPADLKAKILALESLSLPTVSDASSSKSSDLVEQTATLPKMVEIGGKRVRVDDTAQTPVLEDDVRLNESVRPIPNAGIELDDSLAHHVPEYLRKGTSRDWGTPTMIFCLVAALTFVTWISIGSWEELQSLINPKTPLVVLNEFGDSIEEPKRPERLPAEIESPRSTAEPEAEVVVAPKGNLPETTPPPIAPENSPSGPAPNPSGSKLLESKPADRFHPLEVPAVHDENPKPAVTKMDAEPSLPPASSNSGQQISVLEALPSYLTWQPEPEEATTRILFSQSMDRSVGPRRLKANETIRANELLIVPPSMRSTFVIAPGIRWIAADESVIGSDRVGSSAIPKISIRLGRALVESTNLGRTLTISTPMQDLKVEFQDEKSSLSVELRYQRVKGFRFDDLKTDETKKESLAFAIPVLKICGVRGTTRITWPDSEPVLLEVADGLEWFGDGPVRHWSIPSIKDVPWWYENQAQRQIDLQAVEEMQAILRNIDATDSTVAVLQKIEEQRLSEVSLIGIRTRLLMGDYTKILGSDGFLSNSSSRAHRAILIDSLVQAVASYPDGPRQFSGFVSKAEPARALRLLDLFSLPSDEQLAEEVDRGLVEALNSPFIDERALSIFQLSTVVGKEHGYQCDRPSNESLQTWKRLLTTDKIRWAKK
jgi:hypothetical protein